jgi:hypothetical protein
MLGCRQYALHNGFEKMLIITTRISVNKKMLKVITITRNLTYSLWVIIKSSVVEKYGLLNQIKLQN